MMESVEQFLAHAVRIERDAAERFAQLAEAMEAYGNNEVARLFRQLAHYSRLHLNDARMRSGYRNIPDLKQDEFVWPDLESPETAAIWAADPLIGREEALDIALQAETAGLDYYSGILATTTDPEIKAFAKEFAEEEAEHVAELRKWIAAHMAGDPMPARAV